LRAEPSISVPEEPPRGHRERDGRADVDLAAPGLVFGGVSFEFLGDARRHGWSLPANVIECVEAPGATPSIAHVLCSLHHDASLDGETDHHVRWLWNDGAATVRANRVRCTVRKLGNGRYAASARLARGAVTAGAAVRALGHAVLDEEGGFALHAAGVELDGRAVLFTGPSGAGKSTATRHVPGARSFADDRVVVYPTPAQPRQWSVSLMPAGLSRPEATSSPRTLPIAAVLRVDRLAGEVGVRSIGRATAIFAVRESVLHGSSSDENGLLDRVARFTADVAVGEVRTMLGAPLTEPLRRWLAGRRL